MPEPHGTPRTSPFFWNEEVRPGLRVAFTSAAAGNLALHVGDDPDTVLAHRRRLEADMGVATGSLRFMSQTHSDRVVLMEQGSDVQTVSIPGSISAETFAEPAAEPAAEAHRSAAAPEADGMVSLGGSHPLAVLVADCVPIVLADTTGASGGSTPDTAPGADPAIPVLQGAASAGGRATAVVHAGRAGVANGIVGNAVALMRREGAQEITAWIGPSVCGSCYEVPDVMMLDVARRVPEAAARTRSGSASLDLPAAVRRQLIDAGVTVEPVAGPGVLCTLENTELYSHRREPGAGRIAGLVWRH